MGPSTRVGAALPAALPAVLAVVVGAVLTSGCQGPAADPIGPVGVGRTASEGEPGRGPAGRGPASCEGPGRWTLEDPRITESSGIALSHTHPGVLYTHNDRGTPPSLFAVDASGTRAVLDLAVPALDWEDVASTPDGEIWVGDIGDNDGVRDSISVTVVREPEVLVSSVLPSTTYRLRYEDGPHDAEALLVDPRDHRVWVVTKDDGAGRSYVAPVRLDPDRVNVLRYVADAPPGVSGGDFSPDGGSIVLRTQARAYFGRDFRGAAQVVELPSQRQGESVTFTADGRHVLLGSEGSDSSLLCIPVPGPTDR